MQDIAEKRMAAGKRKHTKTLSSEPQIAWQPAQNESRQPTGTSTVNLMRHRKKGGELKNARLLTGGQSKRLRRKCGSSPRLELLQYQTEAGHRAPRQSWPGLSGGESNHPAINEALNRKSWGKRIKNISTEMVLGRFGRDKTRQLPKMVPRSEPRKRPSRRFD